MLELFIIIITIFIPLTLACLLSATETAITAMSLAKIHKLKKDGCDRAATIIKLKEDKEGLISTILLANNSFNILASSVATAFLIKIFGDEGVIYATIMMTILIIVFAEVLPKTYAISNPEKVAISFAQFLKITVLICRPFTKLINKIISLFNFSGHPSLSLVSPTEEIKGTIELHHNQGAVDKEDKYMLDGVFYLGETTLDKVITHRKNMQSINIDQDIKQILKQLSNIKHARIPIWKENTENIIGILNTRELLNMLLIDQDLTKLDINKAITKPVFVHENTTLDEQLADFKAKKNRFAVVIDEYGAIQGVVTLSDILKVLVGDIQDENDKKEEIVLQNDGSCKVKGDLPVRDLNRIMNWNLPVEEASTVAGLLILEAERIPEIGENLEFYQFNFTVLSKEANQITGIKIKKLET